MNVCAHLVEASVGRKTVRGFTLIETLLYIGLFGVLLTSVVLVAYPLMTGADRLNQRVTEEGEAAFVLHKIASALYAAEVTDIEISSGALIIWNGADAVTFREEDDAIELSRGGTFTPLTASRVVFSDFSADYTASTGGNIPHTLVVNFTVGGESYSRTYHVYFN